MDWILAALPTITPYGALLAVSVWIVRQIVTGKLIPEVMHQRIVDAKDEQLKLQAAATREAATGLTKLIENDENILKLLRALGTEEVPR